MILVLHANEQPSREKGNSWPDCSAGEGACYQARWLRLHPQSPQIGKGELWKLSSPHTPTHPIWTYMFLKWGGQAIWWLYTCCEWMNNRGKKTLYMERGPAAKSTLPTKKACFKQEDDFQIMPPSSRHPPWDFAISLVLTPYSPISLLVLIKSLQTPQYPKGVPWITGNK